MCKKHEKIVFLNLFAKTMPRHDTADLKADLKTNRSYIRYAEDWFSTLYID